MFIFHVRFWFLLKNWIPLQVHVNSNQTTVVVPVNSGYRWADVLYRSLRFCSLEKLVKCIIAISRN